MMQPQHKYLLPLVAPFLTIANLQAQAVPAASTSGHHETDVAVTYTEQYSNLVSTPTFWQPGGSVEVSAQVYRGLGLAANVTGNNVPNAANSGIGLTIVSANFGPRYTYYKPIGAERKRSVAVFGQSLIGQAWGFNSYFPTASGVKTDYISFDLQLGGGVDIGVSRHFAVRVFQADWLRTQFPNANTNVQNNLRLAAGIVFRIPQGR
jgi:outer membrane immunogenic protein